MVVGVPGHRFLNVLLPVLEESRPDPDSAIALYPIRMDFLVMRMGQMKLFPAIQMIVLVGHVGTKHDIYLRKNT